jgi:DNA-binding MarR family transcriptional regulator
LEERGFGTFSRRLESRLGIRQFSSEYQILINLYDRCELSTGDLLATSSVSATKFYLSLRKLHAQGLLLTGLDDRDKRKVRYRLTDKARSNMDEIHRRVLVWFQPEPATEQSD